MVNVTGINLLLGVSRLLDAQHFVFGGGNANRRRYFLPYWYCDCSSGYVYCNLQGCMWLLGIGHRYKDVLQPQAAWHMRKEGLWQLCNLSLYTASNELVCNDSVWYGRCYRKTVYVIGGEVQQHLYKFSAGNIYWRDPAPHTLPPLQKPLYKPCNIVKRSGKVDYDYYIVCSNVHNKMQHLSLFCLFVENMLP